MLGVLGAIGAAAFLTLMSWATDVVWEWLPAQVGLDAVPWWWVVLGLLVGAVLIIAAQRLGPGMGSPLDGFHFDVGPSRAIAALSVALATLVFGGVLGPEAPLIVVGTVIGGLLTRGKSPQVQQLAMALGGIAAIGTILGNPFIAAFMVLEFAALGAMPRQALVPIFVALGSGYLVLTGIGPFTGLGGLELAVPGLTEVDQLTFVDLLVGLFVAVVAGAAVLLSRQVGYGLQRVAKLRPSVAILGSAVVIGALATFIMLAFDQPYDVVPFSGETAMGSLITETSALAVLAIVVAKALAYGVSLGGGWRGGPIFPATYIGVAAAVLIGLVITATPMSALIVAGMAAGVAAMLKLPFTAALLAVVIGAGAGLVVTPMAIIGAIVGVAMRMAYDKATGHAGVPMTP
ncbi:MAG: chloride channel protein [Actinobacteria bacterium]|nr:chloride channel protein [Actinomycetota bacterium]